MTENLKDDQCYEFVGLRLKKADRRFVPLSHEVEAVFDLRYASLPKSIPTPAHFLERLYYNFQLFDQIKTERSTCVEIIGVVLEVDRIMKKGTNSIQRVVVVDKSVLKLEFYLWNDDVYQLQAKQGMTMLLQGLKVVRFSTYVSFFVLRCKHIEVNPSLPETVTLTHWWSTGGAEENFREFPELENPIRRFVNAFNYYKKNAGTMKLTIRGLADTYGMHERTLGRFFRSNGIHTYQPEKVAALRQRYNNGEGTMAQLCQDTCVAVGALKSARLQAHETKPKTPQQPQLVGKLRTEIKKKKKGVTIKNIVNKEVSTTYAAITKSRQRAGESKKQQRQTVLKGIRYYLITLVHTRKLLLTSTKIRVKMSGLNMEQLV